MQVITPQFVQNKKVLLRLDLDVPLEKGRVADDFRLCAGMETLLVCLQHAKSTIIMGHIGRPNGREVEELSVAPIVDWLEESLGDKGGWGKLKILENLRFESGEEGCSLEYARELVALGDVYVNEAFATYHPAASTTVLPKLLPSVAGLNFVREVRVLKEIRENPKKPLVAIIGGAKIEDKLPVALALSKIADAVFLGGKLPTEIKEKNISLPRNVLAGRLNTTGTDLTPETVQSWKNALINAQTIIWNGPLGLVEDPKNDQSKFLAELIIKSKAQTVVGGGDTIGYLGRLGLLGGFGFVSTGGGAMLKFLETGTLPTIEALE